MTTWDDILSHYTFDSKSYIEHCEPANLHNLFVDVMPSYPIPAFKPNYNRFTDHTYYNVLASILPSTNILYDFPVTVNVTYVDRTSSGRQSIYFSNFNNFLSLYNHSDFLKMHLHNAWLLGKAKLTIDLPSDYFIQPKYLLIFCGTLKLTEICDNGDANNFDFHSFLFAPCNLMINDSFLLQLLKTSGTINFHENNTILPCLYALLTLNYNLPRTFIWFES